jgi:hypothetical protein
MIKYRVFGYPESSMIIFVDELVVDLDDSFFVSLFCSTLTLEPPRSRILLRLSEFPSAILTSFPVIGAWAKTTGERNNMSSVVQKVFMAINIAC